MHIATFLGMKRAVFVLGQFYCVSTFMEKQSNIMYYMHLVENNTWKLHSHSHCTNEPWGTPSAALKSCNTIKRILNVRDLVNGLMEGETYKYTITGE